MQQHATSKKGEMLNGFDHTSRNEEWKGRAGWDDLTTENDRELKIPRFRITQQLTAPSCIKKKDKQMTPRQPEAQPWLRLPKRPCTIWQIAAGKEEWKKCSLGCTTGELAGGEQGLRECEKRTNIFLDSQMKGRFQ